jgi:hypothetical protein
MRQQIDQSFSNVTTEGAALLGLGYVDVPIVA